MAEICRYCNREKFASAEEYETDIDAKLNRCGRGIAGHDGAYDCLSETHHRSNIRRMRAETLLRTASLLHLMTRDYQERFAGDYRQFREEFPDV